MSLPIILLDNQEHWDCHQCGFCCRGSIIPLNAHDLEQLKQQRWEQHPDFHSKRIRVRSMGIAGGYRLAHQPDGSCVFLDPQGRCRIHSKFGHDAKPTVCQMFPLQLLPQGQQLVLTSRRACPSAAADLGRPLAEHKSFVKRMVDDKRVKIDAIRPMAIKPGETREWKTQKAILHLTSGLLNDQRFPPVRRLVHTLQFASLLEKARTRRLKDEQLIELAQEIANLCPEEARHFFSEPQEPTVYAKVMFRLMAVDCARLHPHCRHRSTWSARIELMRTALKIVRGTGATPIIDRTFPQTTMEQIEKPTGPLPPEVYKPLTRFLETTSSSAMFALADRQGWTLIESIRGLAMLFPVGLWLARWLASGRQPNAQDMLNVVVALDRSQGYAPLTGGLHRLRLSTLSVHDQIERLIVWAAR